MKITAVITSRNDNYGGNLINRAILSLQNFIKRYDEVIYVDWNSNNNSLLDELKFNLNFRNNLKHIKVTDTDIKILNKDLLSIPIVDVLGRNIGIRRASSDFIVSTNIDIITTKPCLNILDKNTLYTAARRNVSINVYNHMVNYPIILGDQLLLNPDKFECFQDTLDKDGNPIWDKDDRWSLVVSCGDYQLAHRDLWYKIKGFEEDMIYRAFADSNIMKKGFIYGSISKLILPVFHLEHSYDHPDNSNKVSTLNPKDKFIKDFTETTNKDTWGFSDYNFLTEIL